jgi:hypothetical protein
MERLPRWAPSPRTFWIETSARKISFVRARCGNAGLNGGAERARQVVGDGKHLLTGYQPALLELRSLQLAGKQTHFAAAAGFARGGCPGRGSGRRPAQVLGFRQISVRREIIMARAKRGPDFSA